MPPTDAPRPVRCAIYTRKSTNHLLEREVNSLASQREICTAYITTQRHRGWVALPQSYDDAGQSGTDPARPALAQLLRDIESGQIDVVIIYKIDRLTRSLSDFIRLIEVFDRYAIAFVSVSQSFDTSDSMGRMILNILLTFSQFERELIAERVRDNIRTRKRHGKWAGGPAPYGYRLTDSGLEVLETEAEQVRFLFKRFLELGAYNRLRNEVLQSGLRTTVKVTKRGTRMGGRDMSSGHVYAILKNPVYVGEITGHDGNYPGQHEAIISREVWDAVQALRQERLQSPPQPGSSRHILTGLLWDSYGRRMVVASEWNKGRYYYYYVSSRAGWASREKLKQFRTHAGRLDKLVVAALADFLLDRQKLRAALKGLGLYGLEIDGLMAMRTGGAERIKAAAVPSLMAIMPALLRTIELAEEHVTLTLRTSELKRFLEWRGKVGFHGRKSEWAWSEASYVLTIPVRAVSAERSLVVPVAARDPDCTAVPKPELLELLREAREAQALVEARRDLSLHDLARSRGKRPAYVSRLLKLNYLAPDIVTAIVDGTQPEHISRRLLLEADLPLDWSLQRQLFGFAPLRDRHRMTSRDEMAGGGDPGAEAATLSLAPDRPDERGNASDQRGEGGDHGGDETQIHNHNITK